MRGISRGRIPWLIMLALAPWGAAHADVSVVVRPDTTCTPFNQQFTVSLYVDRAGNPFDGYETVLLYDPNLLQLVSLAEGEMMIELCYNTWWRDSTDVPGRIFISHVAMCGGLSLTGPGTLSYITFRGRSTTSLASITIHSIKFYRAGYLVPETHRDGAVFVRASCPAIGACCLGGEQCAMLSAADCGNLGGDYQWWTDDCTPNPCAQHHVCCVNEVCSLLLQTECASAGGVWHAGWDSCGPPNPCGQPHVCCVAGVCYLIYESDCATMQGEWHAGWSSCEGDPCAAQGLAEETAGRDAVWLRVVPQPSHQAAHIAYALPGSASLRLEILDATGRVVRRLVEGSGAAGPASIDWNGCDDAGRRVAPGTYFCRLSSGGKVTTERVVRID
jgi:hypothetical protein